MACPECARAIAENRRRIQHQEQAYELGRMHVAAELRETILSFQGLATLMAAGGTVHAGQWARLAAAFESFERGGRWMRNDESVSGPAIIEAQR